jgi:hypothetical protein
VCVEIATQRQGGQLIEFVGFVEFIAFVEFVGFIGIATGRQVGPRKDKVESDW